MAYRDDLDVLQSRREQVATELEAVRRQKDLLEKVTARAERLEQDLAEVDRRLAAFKGHRQLPLLDAVEIRSPCTASWDDMKGAGRVRFCRTCRKNVYDVSRMTRQEAEELIHQSEGGEDLCMRLYRRPDGTILTADCDAGRRRRRVTRMAAAAMALGSAGLVSAAYDPTGPIAARGGRMHSSIQVPIDDDGDAPDDDGDAPRLDDDGMGRPPREPGRHMMGAIRHPLRAEAPKQTMPRAPFGTDADCKDDALFGLR